MPRIWQALVLVIAWLLGAGVGFGVWYAGCWGVMSVVNHYYPQGGSDISFPSSESMVACCCLLHLLPIAVLLGGYEGALIAHRRWIKSTNINKTDSPQQ